MSSKQTVWILGDQLTRRSALFDGRGPDDTRVLFIESLARVKQRPYHKQKVALLWSAMRHFASELTKEGFEVDYYELAANMREGLEEHLTLHRPDGVRVMESAEWGRSAKLAALAEEHGVQCELVENDLFISDKAAFEKRYRGKSSVLLEGFYRDMRRKTGLLMEDGEPVGGQWNYDKDNREMPKKGHVFPSIPSFEPDDITRAVIEEVSRRFPDHFGELDGFGWPVTGADADRFFEDFLSHRLDRFGPFEDAMVTGEPALYHSLLSPLLNLGLLDPLEVCRRAEARYEEGSARLNSVEGFIRQVIGWRELVYQLYHWQMPGYTENNALGADLPLPDFYWSADTAMNCVSQSIDELRRNGINHHIQRRARFAEHIGLTRQRRTPS